MHVERRPRRRLGSYRRARLGCKAADHESGRLPAAAGRAIMAHNSESLPPDLIRGRLSESPATRLAWLSHRTRRADRAAARGHLEGEAESRQVFARMVFGKGELRDAEVVRPRLLALVNARIEIDEMPARIAGSLHDQLDIALAVEGAGIADIAVVVD